MRAVLGVAALVVLAGSALAEERVLHCAETGSVGFLWEEGQAEGQVTQFKGRRYVVKVKVLTSEDRPPRFRDEVEMRTVTPTIGDTAGMSDILYCKRPYRFDPFAELLVCNDTKGLDPWHFNGNKFVHASLLGTPVKGWDPNIYISYGTCTGF